MIRFCLVFSEDDNAIVDVVVVLQATFPGLWLTTVTPDMYRVPDPPLKVFLICFLSFLSVCLPG